MGSGMKDNQYGLAVSMAVASDEVQIVSEGQALHWYALSEQLVVDGLPSEASKADGNEALWIRLGEFDRCAQRCVFLSAKSLLFGSGPETIRGSGQQPGVAAGISGARSWR